MVKVIHVRKTTHSMLNLRLTVSGLIQLPCFMDGFHFIKVSEHWILAPFSPDLFIYFSGFIRSKYFKSKSRMLFAFFTMLIFSVILYLKEYLGIDWFFKIRILKKFKSATMSFRIFLIRPLVILTNVIFKMFNNEIY